MEKVNVIIEESFYGVQMFFIIFQFQGWGAKVFFVFLWSLVSKVVGVWSLINSIFVVVWIFVNLFYFLGLILCF